MLILMISFVFAYFKEITIGREELMTDKLKQNKFRVGEILPHALTFAVVLATFICELSMVIEGFIEKELTISGAAFFLYIGTLVSLGANELVYESIEESRPEIHKCIVFLCLFGGIVSFVAGILISSGLWWDKYPNIKFWVFHILRCIVILTYAALCWPCLEKAIVIWKKTGKSDNVGLGSDENPSDFDIMDNKSGKGDS